jgi:hypothetical protein
LPGLLYAFLYFPTDSHQQTSGQNTITRGQVHAPFAKLQSFHVECVRGDFCDLALIVQRVGRLETARIQQSLQPNRVTPANTKGAGSVSNPPPDPGFTKALHQTDALPSRDVEVYGQYQASGIVES